LAKLKQDPWAGFDDLKQHLPDLKPPAAPRTSDSASGTGSVVVARKPKPRKKS